MNYNNFKGNINNMALTLVTMMLFAACTDKAVACEITNKTYYPQYDTVAINAEHVRFVDVKDYYKSLELLDGKTLVKLRPIDVINSELNVPNAAQADTYLIKACFLDRQKFLDKQNNLDHSWYEVMTIRDALSGLYIPELQLFIAHQGRFYQEGLVHVPVPILVTLNEPITLIDSYTEVVD